MRARFTLLFTLAILLASAVIICSINCSDTEVYFTDAGLEQVVREAINKIESDIHQSDLKDITALDASGNNIGNLSGIERCTGLIELNLNNNVIEDIEPLSELSKIEKLNLSQNSISDISSLSNLTNLEWLSLGRNTVSDISFLNNLINIRNLVLSVNQVSDISALSGLNRLQALQLHMNLVSDISVLEQLTSLNELGLMGNDITDIKPLVLNSGLGSGDNIDLCDNPLDTTSLEIYIPQLREKGVICLCNS